MDDTDLSSAMLGRIGRHVMTVPLALIAALAALGLGRWLGGALYGDAIPRGWVALSFVAAGLVFAALYVGAALRMLRCPACEGFVGRQVNVQMTVFASRHDRSCRHCGATIFDDRLPRLARVAQVVLGVGTFVLFLTLAILHRGG